jgi:hypothetical protein
MQARNLLILLDSISDVQLDQMAFKCSGSADRDESEIHRERQPVIQAVCCSQGGPLTGGQPVWWAAVAEL